MVLRSMKDLRAPSNELISEVLSIIADEGVYYEARVLAARALVDLLTRSDVEYAEDRGAVLHRVMEKMRTLLDSLGPPVLHDAIRTFMTAIESTR